jgi:hypothetical protein
MQLGEPADDIDLNFRQDFIGLLIDGQADNFLCFYPRRRGWTRLMAFAGEGAASWAKL